MLDAAGVVGGGLISSSCYMSLDRGFWERERERISELGTCLKYKLLGSTSDLALQMLWRHGAQRSDIAAGPQGDSDAHLSLGTATLDSEGALEECLLCSPDRKRAACDVGDVSTASQGDHLASCPGVTPISG